MPFSGPFFGQSRTSSATNPITVASYVVGSDDRLLVILLKGVGATNRAGGAPTWGGRTFLQAGSTQKAASSPECSAEIWYLLNPVKGTAPLVIPNTGAITCYYTVIIGRMTNPTSGEHAAFMAAVGANGTSVDPSCGTVTLTDAGGIGLAIVATGAQTWSPTAFSGTVMDNNDDGADGEGQQVMNNPAVGPSTFSWSFATSDDWGACAAYFKPVAPRALNNYSDGVTCVSAGIMSVTGRKFPG